MQTCVYREKYGNASSNSEKYLKNRRDAYSNLHLSIYGIKKPNPAREIVALISSTKLFSLKALIFLLSSHSKKLLRLKYVKNISQNSETCTVLTKNYVHLFILCLFRDAGEKVPEFSAAAASGGGANSRPPTAAKPSGGVSKPAGGSGKPKPGR
jgi:hypothetical protein